MRRTLINDLIFLLEIRDVLADKYLSSATTKAKKTETYVGASCGQKVKALQWVKDNAEIAHYMEDDDLNEFISELLSA